MFTNLAGLAAMSYCDWHEIQMFLYNKRIREVKPTRDQKIQTLGLRTDSWTRCSLAFYFSLIIALGPFLRCLWRSRF